ncbi:MAG: hypothetical protein AAGJ69_11300, partial [Cyanobacteria bacterium J06559_1]
APGHHAKTPPDRPYDESCSLGGSLLSMRYRVQWAGSVNEIDSTDNPFVRQFFSAQVQGPIQVTG